MSWRSFLKGALLMAASAALIALMTLAGFVAFVYATSDGGLGLGVSSQGVSIKRISETLTRDGAQYHFGGESLLGEGCWAMLLDSQGQAVWSLRKPPDVPDQYTIADVAAFTRWYLRDYPVRCWVREDGLLVVGSPKGSLWKHDMTMDMRAMLQMPFWLGGIFLLTLGCVLGLSYRAARHWFRQAQQARDAARSDWINGVSHDIRTPLSVVMGYAAQLEDAPDIAPARRRQAAVIRAQSQAIRDLVNDLNLTMRLDCAMQPLRKEALHPDRFLRQVAADFLNGGMADGFSLDMAFPDGPLPAIEADPFLLRRAVNNLLTNCVRHNLPGCAIRLGARLQDDALVLWVEGGQADDAPVPDDAHRPPEPDGGAAHGTGLRLVAQIAEAHGGRAKLHAGTPFCCELWLPLGREAR